ncbi:TOX high mobility group box family member 3 [Platysternon megacephalum]|uniref:TOX high mobility group box family member 3 n=1 Tax=Platysternon megacephalum TaxID=55544 RepID=A0A4D9ENK3_9SAUR|nr:TOX high mobility group box family member 3 [Platysternon megacephalum]
MELPTQQSTATLPHGSQALPTCCYVAPNQGDATVWGRRHIPGFTAPHPTSVVLWGRRCGGWRTPLPLLRKQLRLGTPTTHPKGDTAGSQGKAPLHLGTA